MIKALFVNNLQVNNVIYNLHVFRRVVQFISIHSWDLILFFKKILKPEKKLSMNVYNK